MAPELPARREYQGVIRVVVTAVQRACREQAVYAHHPIPGHLQVLPFFLMPPDLLQPNQLHRAGWGEQTACSPT
jgi:hypothetical protein